MRDNPVATGSSGLSAMRKYATGRASAGSAGYAIAAASDAMTQQLTARRLATAWSTFELSTGDRRM
jgi:hypothetical protein